MISHKFKKNLGENIGNYITLVESIIKSLPQSPTSYSIKPIECFSNIRTSKAMLRIYWEELLGRAHFSAVTSIIRSYRWCQGMVAAQDNGLFLPYCASYRGLIESVADSADSLNNVALNLAKHKNIINNILLEENPLPERDDIFITTELEEVLIHYSHAKVFSGTEKAQPGQNAKPNSHYIDTLKKANVPKIAEIYSDLCQYTHPSSDSIAYLCKFIDQSTFSLSLNKEKRLIEDLITEQRATMIDLIMYGFTPSILILKVLLHYNIERYHSKIADSINCSSIPAWGQCESFLNVAGIPTCPSGKYKIK